MTNVLRETLNNESLMINKKLKLQLIMADVTMTVAQAQASLQLVMIPK